MNKLIESHLLGTILLLTVILLLVGCMSAIANDAEQKVLWKESKAYQERIASFTIKPEEALRLVLVEVKKPESVQKKRYTFGEPLFIVGRWYWFGEATKTEIFVGGYYVNGDTGKIEYRESTKTIKSRAKKLPKETWSKITPLPETSSHP